jgi:hypothetical protein
VRNGIEVLADVGVDDLAISLVQAMGYVIDGVMG